jgi:hypothetical protein
MLNQETLKRGSTVTFIIAEVSFLNYQPLFKLALCFQSLMTSETFPWTSHICHTHHAQNTLFLQILSIMVCSTSLALACLTKDGRSLFRRWMPFCNGRTPLLSHNILPLKKANEKVCGKICVGFSWFWNLISIGWHVWCFTLSNKGPFIMVGTSFTLQFTYWFPWIYKSFLVMCMY